MNIDELLSGSLWGMRSALLARELSALELVEGALRRIEDDEPALLAWAHVDADGALAAARGVDVERQPLAGIPFGAKDIIDIRGLPTRFGTTWIAAEPARFDAWCVAAMRAAGAIPLGKLQTTMFAYADPAPTRNPWNPDRTPGGSSAGSGAAVGARQIPFAFGSQTGASTLRPAVYNGSVGYKPTFGAIPTAGMAALSPTMDHVAMICRNAEDATALFAVFAPEVAKADLAGSPRILAATAFLEHLVDPEVHRMLESVIERAVADGAQVARADLPAALDAEERCWFTICSYEANANLGAELRERAQGSKIFELAAQGGATSSRTYRDALLERRALQAAVDATLADFDAVLLPAGGPAPDPSTTGIVHVPFFRPWTMFGNPAISIPAALTADGMPIGFQLVGKRHDDANLLALARRLERAVAFDNPGPRIRSRTAAP